MIIIPAIDLMDGRCVRLFQGDRSNPIIYKHHPIDIGLQFQESGATMLHLIDLDAAFDIPCAVNRMIIENMVKELSIPIQVGGGMRTLDDLWLASDSGASRMIVSTAAAESPKLLSLFTTCFGSRIIAGIEVQNARVRTHGWQVEEDITVADLVERAVQCGVGGIIHTDIQQDGTLAGVNDEVARNIAKMSTIPVIVAGGIGTLNDINSLLSRAGSYVTGLIIGRALHERRFSLEDAIAVAREQIVPALP